MTESKFSIISIKLNQNDAPSKNNQLNTHVAMRVMSLGAYDVIAV